MDFLENFDGKLVDAITTKNPFIFSNHQKIELSSNLDPFDVQGSSIGQTEDEVNETVNLLIKNIKAVVKHFAESFELIFFTYGGSYSVVYYIFDGLRLKSGGGALYDLAPEDIENFDSEQEYDQACNDFVNEASSEIKEGINLDYYIELIKDNGINEI